MTPPETPPADRRWPRRVYGEGSEPDARFTFANERTFLAWIRTGLALLAAGVAVAAFGGTGPDRPWQNQVAALLLIGLGVLSGVSAYLRWMQQERALRRGDPLPSSGMMPVLALSVVVIAALGVTLVV
ncbi:DUF202 domain-containing protein [Naumannella cuiyingiana]|uniref:Putative membrane protein n=1 Tax=Naumannella cuiyingiana TaxID=1347891 RepID=A0A7Z0D8F3_9ACTN|nr:putative membrane protein [Naumannella cuiyingiana]